MICGSKFRFSTGLGVTGGSALIHEFYTREVPNPVHLTVDTGFNYGEGTIKAYVSVNLSLGDRPLAAQFQEIPVDLRMLEAERVGCKCSALLSNVDIWIPNFLIVVSFIFRYLWNFVIFIVQCVNIIYITLILHDSGLLLCCIITVYFTIL